jgi:L-alanine-DL-glutamate epimerase-like enolase superfamily enzyme
MRINGLDIFLCNTPFKNGYHSPHMLRLRAESIIINIKFDNGIEGYGESPPRAYVTRENLESVVVLIRDHFSPSLLGLEIASVDDIQDTLNLLEHKCLNNQLSPYLSALGAVDIALLDGLGKSMKIPLSDLLGPIASQSITYTVPIPLLPIEMIRKIPKYLSGSDFSSVKVLMGKSEEENLARVKSVREIFGTDIEMSVEANGKWTYPQALANLSKLKRYNISLVEQPVPCDDIDGLKNIREKTGLPVMVDESLCTLSDARQLVEAEACDFFNIKISKCGGLLKSKKIADFALSKGLSFQLGTHVGETDILNRAGQSLALVSPNIIHFEGFSSLLFKQAWDGNELKQETSSYNCPLSINSEINLTHQSLQMLHSFNLFDN